MTYVPSRHSIPKVVTAHWRPCHRYFGERLAAELHVVVVRDNGRVAIHDFGFLAFQGETFVGVAFNCAVIVARRSSTVS